MFRCRRSLGSRDWCSNGKEIFEALKQFALKNPHLRFSAVAELAEDVDGRKFYRLRLKRVFSDTPCSIGIFLHSHEQERDSISLCDGDGIGYLWNHLFIGNVADDLRSDVSGEQSVIEWVELVRNYLAKVLRAKT